MAIGVTARDFVTMETVSPGASLSITCLVASGVTSRGENPVPPVVKMSATPNSSVHRYSTFYEVEKLLDPISPSVIIINITYTKFFKGHL